MVLVLARMWVKQKILRPLIHYVCSISSNFRIVGKCSVIVGSSNAAKDGIIITSILKPMDVGKY